jgi:hypothetical protein
MSIAHDDEVYPDCGDDDDDEEVDEERIEGFGGGKRVDGKAWQLRQGPSFRSVLYPKCT